MVFPFIPLIGAAAGIAGQLIQASAAKKQASEDRKFQLELIAARARALAIAGPAALPGGPGPSQLQLAQARAIQPTALAILPRVQPIARAPLQVRPAIAPPVRAIQVRAPMQNGIALSQDQRTLVKLLQAAFDGMQDETLRAIARKNQFTRRDFIKITADDEDIRDVIVAFQQIIPILRSETNIALQFLFDKINDALKPRRRRRGVSLKTMMRSLKAFGRFKTLAKKAGASLTPPKCP